MMNTNNTITKFEEEKKGHVICFYNIFIFMALNIKRKTGSQLIYSRTVIIKTRHGRAEISLIRG